MADAKEDLPEYIVKGKVYTTKFQVIADIVFILGAGSSGFFLVIGIPYLIYLYCNLREAYFLITDKYKCKKCHKEFEVLSVQKKRIYWRVGGCINKFELSDSSPDEKGIIRINDKISDDDGEYVPDDEEHAWEDFKPTIKTELIEIDSNEAELMLNNADSVIGRIIYTSRRLINLKKNYAIDDTDVYYVEGRAIFKFYKFSDWRTKLVRADYNNDLFDDVRGIFEYNGRYWKIKK